MNSLVCALSLILSCGSVTAPLLNMGAAGATVADTYTTQKNMDLCRVRPGCVPSSIEINPVTRSLQSHGRAVAYVSTAAYLVGVSWAAQKMRESRGWTRRVWWLPQVLMMAGSSVAAGHNLQVYRRELRECGTGCAAALRGMFSRPPAAPLLVIGF